MQASTRTTERPGPLEPDRDCPRCVRLKAFRETQRIAFPGWHNAPVPPFGPRDAPLLIVGLAPGLRGANRTGRAFTGDFAGEVLYPGLVRHGLARGKFAADPADGLELTRCRIVNAVRCVPPANRPTPAEVAACRSFLVEEFRHAAARVVLALGRIAHEAVLRAHGLPLRRLPFSHGGVQALDDRRWLVGSYHTSRYNVNTGRLTLAMFDEVLGRAVRLLERP